MTRISTEPNFVEARRKYRPAIPAVLRDLRSLEITAGDTPTAEAPEDQWEQLAAHFPLTKDQALLNFRPSTQARPLRKSLAVGVVLSGGQAPGGHNVICGIFDALAELAEEPRLIGFLGGPSGIIENKTLVIDAETIEKYRNTGGFDMLGSGRTKIETQAQFAQTRDVLKNHELDALAIIGGDDSNTNAAFLAEYLKKEGSATVVIGVPKTIDGDLKNRFVETSFGFDTAVRLYSELVSNICRDALSAKKYYHFVRLMGRSASHITLEAALQTQPNVALISEEISEQSLTLRQLVGQLGEIVTQRAQDDKNYGVVLVPEGLIEFIPEIRSLINELNELLADHSEYIATLSGFTEQSEYINRKLSRDASYTFSSLPIDIQRQLLMDRDPHGNVQVSRIETEKLLIEMLSDHLAEAKAEGRFNGKFSTQHHFFGYEGRCAAPTNFDANYAYALGRTAVALAQGGATGYMAAVKNLAAPPDTWEAMGAPLFAMLNIEHRKGKDKPVIRKSLVATDSPAFKAFAKHRELWAKDDHYRFTGAIQYFGDATLTDKVPFSVALDQSQLQISETSSGGM